MDNFSVNFRANNARTSSAQSAVLQDYQPSNNMAAFSSINFLPVLLLLIQQILTQLSQQLSQTASQGQNQQVAQNEVDASQATTAQGLAGQPASTQTTVATDTAQPTTTAGVAANQPTVVQPAALTTTPAAGAATQPTTPVATAVAVTTDTAVTATASAQGQSTQAATADTSAANGGEVIDVYLLGGQSNAVGLGDKRLESALEKVLGADTDQHKTNVFSYAIGGSNLYQHWKPDGTADSRADGPLYKTFQTQMDAYINRLQKANPDAQINIKGMFWHQGESDALGSKGNEYEQNLTNFIQDVRATTGIEDLPFMIGRLNEVEPHNFTPVQQAQDAVGAKDPNAVSVNLEEIKGQAVGVHFTTKGYDNMARLFAESYQANFA